MRTTLSVDDELLAAARRRARAQGVSLGSVVEAALRRELSAPPLDDVVVVPVFRGGGGLRAGVDLTSAASVHELLDEGLDLDRRR